MHSFRKIKYSKMLRIVLSKFYFSEPKQKSIKLYIVNKKKYVCIDKLTLLAWTILIFREDGGGAAVSTQLYIKVCNTMKRNMKKKIGTSSHL